MKTTTLFRIMWILVAVVFVFLMLMGAWGEVVFLAIISVGSYCIGRWLRTKDDQATP